MAQHVAADGDDVRPLAGSDRAGQQDGPRLAELIELALERRPAPRDVAEALEPVQVAERLALLMG